MRGALILYFQVCCFIHYYFYLSSSQPSSLKALTNRNNWSTLNKSDINFEQRTSRALNSSITGVAPQVGPKTRSDRVFSQMRGTPQVEKEAIEADEMIKSRRGFTSQQNRVRPKIKQFSIKSRGNQGLSSQLKDLRN